MNKQFFWASSLFLMSSFTGAFAQQEMSYRDKVKAAEVDGWYLEAMGGANHAMTENMDGGTHHKYGITKQSVGVGTYIGVGKEWKPLWGWRVDFGHNSNKGRANFYIYKPKYYGFNDMELFADLTLDIMDLIKPQRKHPRFDLKGFVGAGGLQTYGYSSDSLSYSGSFDNKAGLCWGFRGGVIARYRLSDDVFVKMEATQYALDDNFSGVDGNWYFDGRQNLSLGLVWQLKPYRKAEKQIDTVYIEVPTPVAAEPAPVVKDTTPAKPTVNVVTVYREPLGEGVKQRTMQGKSYLAFASNSTAIKPDLNNNPSELRKIREAIDLVKQDTTITITSIGIHGYSSPDGKYASNARLAQGRSESLKKYLTGIYNFTPGLITASSTPEDWDGMKEYFQNTTTGNSEQILSIIENTADPDARETKIKTAMGATAYNALKSSLYPKLRHSDFIINYSVRDFTLDETKSLIVKKPNLLSQKEMYKVAFSYAKNSYKFNEALQTAAKQYPESNVANLNAANAALEAGKIDEAVSYLNKAGELPEAIHARGVVAALKGDYDTAKNLLKQSYDLGIKESEQVLIYKK